MLHATGRFTAAAAALSIEMDTKTQMACEEKDKEQLLFSAWYASNSKADMKKLVKHQRGMKFSKPLPTSELLAAATELEKEKEERFTEQILFCKWYDAWFAATKEENDWWKPGNPFIVHFEAAKAAWDELKRFQANDMNHAQAVFVDDWFAYESHWREMLEAWPESDPVETLRRKAACSQTGAACSSVC